METNRDVLTTGLGWAEQLVHQLGTQESSMVMSSPMVKRRVTMLRESQNMMRDPAVTTSMVLKLEGDLVPVKILFDVLTIALLVSF